MPGMSGYELARQIRARPDAHQPVLVALTGYGQESDRQIAVEAGFDHHLSKPISLTALQQVLAGLEK
jgi:CheY-like chemotaxis protein